MPYIGTCFRFYTQMRVQKNNKAFAYRIYSHFTQQCILGEIAFGLFCKSVEGKFSSLGEKGNKLGLVYEC